MLWITLLAMVFASFGFVSLAETRRPIVKFKGSIVSQTVVDETTSVWVIGDQEVKITADTDIYEEEGEAVVGAYVMVVALDADEMPEAISVRVLSPAGEAVEIGLQGVISEYVVDDHLVVNGITVLLTPETGYSGEIAVGVLVAIRAQLDANVYTALQVTAIQTQKERTVVFTGEVEVITDEAWTISGRVVTIVEDTQISGDPQVGDEVSVRAKQLSDGTLEALNIIKKPVRPTPSPVSFTGIIQRFPNDLIGRWIISGRTVFVTETTVITGTAQLGASVDVVALMQGNGRLEALTLDIAEPETEHLRGEIVKFPPSKLGRWVIGQWTVVVGTETVIHGTPVVGAMAEFDVIRQGQSGVLVATEIWIEEPVVTEPTTPAEGPTPTPTKTHGPHK